MGETQIFTCQTGPLSLALRVVEGDRAALPRVPRGVSSLGTGQVSVREAYGREAQWGAPGGRGFCLERKRAFGGVVLGRTGRSIKQGEQKTRKHWCWEEPKLPKGFVSLGIDLHDLLWPSVLVSHQALLFLPLKCIFMFSFLIQFTHYARLLFLKYHLDPVTSQLKTFQGFLLSLDQE